MKQVIFLLAVVFGWSVNAQIYINSGSTNSNSNTSSTQEEGSIKVVTPTVTTTKTTATVTTPVATVTTPTTTSYSSTSYTTTNSSLSVDEDVPPNAEPGKCYARCLIEDQYTYVNEQVIDQPRTIKKVKIPALYKTVYDTVVLKPQTTKVINVPAVYENVTEEVMATPATTKWVKGKADAGCLSANPEDCQVMCLVEVPATYKKVTSKKMVKQAYTYNETVPMEYKIQTKEILVTPERLVEQETPATYKTVQKRVLQKKGGYEVWREILCGDDLTSAKIIQIQKALKSKGYNPGPIDDIFGSQTKAALVQYQKDNNLPVGNLNIETLKSLGVN